MTTIDRIAVIGRRVVGVITPSATAWRGATTGVYLLAAILLGAFFASYFLQDFSLQKLPAFVLRIGSLLLLGTLGMLALMLVGQISQSYRRALFLSAPFVVLVAAPGGLWQSIAFGSAPAIVN